MSRSCNQMESLPRSISSTGTLGTTDATGNYLAAASRVTGNVGGNYTFDLVAGKLQPNLNVSYDDGFFFYADNRLARPSSGSSIRPLPGICPTMHGVLRRGGKNPTTRSITRVDPSKVVLETFSGRRRRAHLDAPFTSNSDMAAFVKVA